VQQETHHDTPSGHACLHIVLAVYSEATACMRQDMCISDHNHPSLYLLALPSPAIMSALYFSSIHACWNDSRSTSAQAKSMAAGNCSISPHPVSSKQSSVGHQVDTHLHTMLLVVSMTSNNGRFTGPALHFSFISKHFMLTMNTTKQWKHSNCSSLLDESQR